MARLELTRLVLFALEWLLSAACLGVIPNQLYRVTVDSLDNVTPIHVCAIGAAWFCRFAIVWTVLAFLILTVCIIWHLAGKFFLFFNSRMEWGSRCSSENNHSSCPSMKRVCHSQIDNPRPDSLNERFLHCIEFVMILLYPMFCHLFVSVGRVLLPIRTPCSP
jgi:hypothetical protein